MLITFGIIIIVVQTFIILWYVLWEKEYSGTIVVTDEDGKRTFSLELDIDPEELAERNSVTFKIE